MDFASSRALLERFGRVGARAFITLGCALLLAGLPLPARADGFIGYYALNNFSLMNFGGFLPNGTASSPDPMTLILTGTNDGSGLPGSTDLTIASETSGLLQFSYVFTTSDDPTFEYTGYLVSGNFFPLADTSGESGSVIVPLSSGETFGFSVGSVDNTGGAGVLTVTDFVAPVTPEPGTIQLLLVGAAAILAWKLRCIRLLFRFRRMAGLVVVAAVAVCSMSTMWAQAQVFYSPTNVTGQLSLMNVVNVTQQAQAALTPSVSMPVLELAEVKRITPLREQSGLHSSRTDMLARLEARPLASSSSGNSLTITPLAGVTGFNALSHLDQRDANNGNQLSIEPPNPSIGAGNGYVLEGVNDAIQIYNNTGTPALPVVLSSNQLFGLAPAFNRANGAYGVSPTDMRVFFDAGINRWFVIQRDQDNDIFGDPLNSSHLYIAVSQSADPTANYSIYLMDTTNPNHPGCPCIDDYPQIGADQYGLHIAWNEYNAQSQQFLDAAILSISKASFTLGATAPTAVQFIVPYVTGFEFAIQPATTPPGASNYLASGGLEYFVSSSHAFGNGGEVALWAAYNTSSLGTLGPGGTPTMTLTQVGIPALAYQSPDVANQRPGPTPQGTSQGAPLEFLDGGDTRVQSLSYAGGSLYLTLGTGVTDQNGTWVVGGAYIVLSPTFRSGVLAAKVLNQGYLFVNSNHLLRPAIAVNAQGVGAIAVTLVGPSWYPSAALIPFSGLSTPTSIEVAAAGALPEDGFTGYPSDNGDGVARWGDYNTAMAASDGSIWMVVEYIGNYPRTVAANWNTFAMHLKP